MRRLKQEDQINSRKRFFLLLAIGGFAVLATVVAEIWLVNRLSSYGERIKELQQVKAELELENQILENQIARKSSLQNIEEKAKQLGFTQISNIEYLKDESLASAQ